MIGEGFMAIRRFTLRRGARGAKSLGLTKMSAFRWDSLLRVRVEDVPEILVELPQQQRRQHRRLPCDCITCYFTTATNIEPAHQTVL